MINERVNERSFNLWLCVLLDKMIYIYIYSTRASTKYVLLYFTINFAPNTKYQSNTLIRWINDYSISDSVPKLHLACCWQSG